MDMRCSRCGYEWSGNPTYCPMCDEEVIFVIDKYAEQPENQNTAYPKRMSQNEQDPGRDD